MQYRPGHDPYCEALPLGAALFGALLKQETDKRRLGELLIADWLLTGAQLMKTLRGNAQAHLLDLFLCRPRSRPTSGST